MKQIISLFSIVLVAGLISCGNDKTEKTGSDNMSSETKGSAAAEKNLASTHVVMNAISTGDAGGIDSAVASDFVDHTDRGDMNRDSLKAMVSMMHKMDPSMKMETISEAANDDYAFSLIRIMGTSDGNMGMPKGPYDMKAMEVTKFKDGKAIEHWEYMTVPDMMKMMPQAPRMDDKTKAK